MAKYAKITFMTVRLILNGGTENWPYAGQRTVDEVQQLVRECMESGTVMEVPVDIDGVSIVMLLNGKA
ncbi:MAG: hypothetical protein ACC652_04605, partial [Acidimicrobiales bacterium]